MTPVDSHRPSTEFARLSPKPPLLSSQAGAQFGGDRTAGRVFVCNRLTLSNTYRGRPYLGSSITPVDLSQWTCFYPPSLLCCHSGLLQPLWTALCKDGRVDCSELSASAGDPSSLHLLGLWKRLRKMHRKGRQGSNIRIMCNIFFSFLLFLGYSTP